MEKEFDYLVKNLFPIMEKFNKERIFVNKNHESIDKKVIETHLRYQKYLKEIAIIFKKLSIYKIKDPTGKKFNPTKHNAVYTKNNPEEDEGIVLETLSNGYEKGNKVLKFCDVVVNKYD